MVPDRPSWYDKGGTLLSARASWSRPWTVTKSVSTHSFLLGKDEAGTLPNLLVGRRFLKFSSRRGPQDAARSTRCRRAPGLNPTFFLRFPFRIVHLAPPLQHSVLVVRVASAVSRRLSWAFGCAMARLRLISGSVSLLRGQLTQQVSRKVAPRPTGVVSWFEASYELMSGRRS